MSISARTISARQSSLALLFGTILVAPLAALPTDPAKLASGEPTGTYTPDGTCTAIPDDAYDGSLASMACLTVPGVDLLVTDVNVDLSLNHTWIGDLTIKVVSPQGTVVTLQSRADFAEPADDGTGCCGDSSDLIETSPFTFDDDATDSAEAMGTTIGGTEFACQDDAICDYFPFPDTGPGVNLADFNDERGNGDWLVCVGDSATGDTGDVCLAALTLDGIPGGCRSTSNGELSCIDPIPSLSPSGLALLFLILAGAGCWMLFRR